MTDQPNYLSNDSIGSNSQENNLLAKAPALTDRQMLVLGAAAGGLLSFVGVALSIEMTHTAPAELSQVTVGTAIAIPFISGILAYRLKQPFLDALGAIMNSLPY